MRAAIQRYSKAIENACTSCASCGEFSARMALQRIPLGDNRLRPEIGGPLGEFGQLIKGEYYFKIGRTTGITAGV
jgi:hypothetical protein